jgi:GntR family transcriptional regulator
MLLRIEPTSSSPIYRQIADQIRDQVVSGQLKTGIQLPSVRQLAEELAVNQNTILKVYNELCREGLLKMERGSGTFVADVGPARKTEECRQIISHILSHAVEKGRSMNIDLATMEEMLKNEYHKQAGESR